MFLGWHEQVRVEFNFGSNPLAFGTDTVRAVETERSRLQFHIADPAVRAGVSRTENHVAPTAVAIVRVVITGDDKPITVLRCQVDRFCDSGA